MFPLTRLKVARAVSTPCSARDSSGTKLGPGAMDLGIASAVPHNVGWILGPIGFEDYLVILVGGSWAQFICRQSFNPDVAPLPTDRHPTIEKICALPPPQAMSKK